MNQILILYLEYVYVSFMDFFYVCHQCNTKGFFHQCGDGVFVRRLADNVRCQTVYGIEASGVFPEAGGPVVADDRIFRQMLNVHNMREDNNVEQILQQRILQLTPVISVAEEKQIMPYLSGCVSSRWYPDFADITATNANKGNGLLDIISHEGISIDETMAFGDGGNDLSIIEKAGLSVAMGNANQALKEVADYVTSSVDEDGVYNAMKRFVL